MPATTSSDEPQGFFSSLMSTISDFVPSAKADEKEEEEKEEEAPAEEEEEEEEPEDEAPAIREACETSKCSTYKHHFDHCQEKVQAGHAKGEDCVEEMFHLMHCVDGCATGKIFSKLV